MSAHAPVRSLVPQLRQSAYLRSAYPLLHQPYAASAPGSFAYGAEHRYQGPEGWGQGVEPAEREGELSGWWGDWRKRVGERRKQRKVARAQRRQARKAARKKRWSDYRQLRKSGASLKTRRKFVGRSLRAHRQDVKSGLRATKSEYRRDQRLNKEEKKKAKAGTSMTRSEIAEADALARAGITAESVAADVEQEATEDQAQPALPSTSFLWPTDKPWYLRPATIGGGVVAVGLAVVLLTAKRRPRPSRETK